MPEKIWLPSEEKLTEQKALRRYAGLHRRLRISEIAAPVFESHTRMVSSAEPETIRTLSGDIATETTASVCPASTNNSGDQLRWKPPDTEGYRSARWNVRYRAVFVGVNGSADAYTSRGWHSMESIKTPTKRHVSRTISQSPESSGACNYRI